MTPSAPTPPAPSSRRRRWSRTSAIAVAALITGTLGVVGINQALAATAGPITGLGGKCVDVAGARSANRARVQLFDCNGTAAQNWTVAADGSLQALARCLGVASTGDGGRVQLADCDGGAAQRWTARDGQLVNAGSGRCLDATGNSSANGTRLQVWTCAPGAANQRWTLPGGGTPPAPPATSSGPTAAPTTVPPATTPATTPPATTPPATTPPATTPPATSADTAFPIRAAFYYPWYPENFQPIGSGTKYTPSAGFYNGDDPAVVDRQIADMQYAGLQSGIASWWGPGTREDRRLGLLMAEATKLNFSWSAYYEDEGFGDPSAATISADLVHLRQYSDSPTWLHIGGRPVIFAYGDGADGCSMVSRWKQANTSGYYVVLKVFGGYRGCVDQPDGWHQYAPGGHIDVQTGYSVVISPGFFKNDAMTPLLVRDVERFRADATTMALSKAPFQLVTTYNEWGEGTSVESTTDWPSASGHGQYVDVLHDVFAANPR